MKSRRTVKQAITKEINEIGHMNDFEFIVNFVETHFTFEEELVPCNIEGSRYYYGKNIPSICMGELGCAYFEHCPKFGGNDNPRSDYWDGPVED
jgi:hypothetical protein